MSSPRKPGACTLAWFAVVALVLFGAPSQRQSSAHRSEQETALTKLASGLSSGELALAPGQRGIQAHKFLKPWLFVGSPGQVRLSPTSLPFPARTGLTNTSSRPLSRNTLVGIVELRI